MAHARSANGNGPGAYGCGGYKGNGGAVIHRPHHYITRAGVYETRRSSRRSPVGGNESQKTLSNAGKFWSPREDKVLCARYDAGVNITDLATKHGRTQGAITFRLVKLGKLQAGSEMGPKTSNPKRTQIKYQINSTVYSLDTKLLPNSPGLKCVDCGKALSVDPCKAANGYLCTSCSKRKLEMRNNISNKIQPRHKIITRRIDEGIAGTREDNKKMRTWRLS